MAPHSLSTKQLLFMFLKWAKPLQAEVNFNLHSSVLILALFLFLPFFLNLSYVSELGTRHWTNLLLVSAEHAVLVRF